MSVRAVMISIQPQWCSLIANGKKTLEVRKSKSKIRTPFKCYIYCTKGKNKLFWTGKRYSYTDDHSHNAFDKAGNGKIIGEFVCDSIFPISVEYSDTSSSIALNEFPYTCLTDKQIMDYLGNGKTGYAWHISDLKIYDQPKELSKFCIEDKLAIKMCEHRFRTGQPEDVARHGGWLQGGFICTKSGEPEWCENCLSKPLTRPPQSWCYVEGVEI